MGFAVRSLKGKDFQWCADVLEDGFEIRPDLRNKLPQLWSALIVIDALTMIGIIDDTTHERVAFGAAGVLSEECLELALTSPEPNLAVRIFERELQNLDSSRPSRPLIMRLKDIREVNHPKIGVNLAVLHYSEVIPGRTDHEIRTVRDKALHALIETQRGYALKEFVFELSTGPLFSRGPAGATAGAGGAF